MTTEIYYPSDASEFQNIRSFQDIHPGPINASTARLSRSVATRIDAGLWSTAKGLRRTASSLRSAEGLRDMAALGEMTANTASKLDTAARYLEDHDCQRIAADAKGMVARNPGRSLMAAATLGFMFAMAFKRRD